MKQPPKNYPTVEDEDMAEVFEFSHYISGLAGPEVYETGRPTNNEGFEIQEWTGGRNLGRKSRVDKRRSVSETFKGCGEKGPRRGRRNVEKDN